jgi:hypothetical protein
MATRQGDSEALVKRVKAVEPLGWRVEETPDGWKCFDRRGGMWTIHRTYSDRRSLTNNVKDLENKGGLVADETEMKKVRLKARQEALRTDRQAAERKAAQLANQQSDLLMRAAGPYFTEAEEPDLDWLTSPHPSPWMRWMYITPKIAEYLLTHHNDDNRPINEEIARDYGGLMVTDQWYLTHQGLAIDIRAQVQDAQHRLLAVQYAGSMDPEIKVPFAVFVGMPPQNFKTIDTGRARSAAQMLKKEGYAGGTHLVTLLRTVAAYGTDNPRGFTKNKKLPTVVAFELYEKDKEGYDESIALGSRGYKRTRITPGILATAHYLICKVNGRDNPYVHAFFEGLITNRKYNTDRVLPDDDPRRVLLNKLIHSRPPNPVEGAHWVITAWNNVCRGNHPRSLRIPEFVQQPLKIVPGAGHTPRALAGEVDDVILEAQ